MTGLNVNYATRDHRCHVDQIEKREEHEDGGRESPYLLFERVRLRFEDVGYHALQNEKIGQGEKALSDRVRDNDACPPIVVQCDLFCFVDELFCGEGVRLIGGVGQAGPFPHFMIVTHGHE